VITIELRGLELHAHHGVEQRERERGQAFLFDVWIDVEDDELDDRIENTVDYREVAAAVRALSSARTYALLETLAAELADELLERFPVARARVRVRKPEVDLDAPVEWTAAIAERSRT
jgi:dihydroneopterin aldolase